MIFDARPLPITKDVPFTIISIGPLNGAFFFFNICIPGTTPKFARRVFALIPAFTRKTVTTSPFSHSVKHLIKGISIILSSSSSFGIESIILYHF
jgi:hypothetical protein